MKGNQYQLVRLMAAMKVETGMLTTNDGLSRLFRSCL